MTPKQYELATPLITQLGKINGAITSTKVMIDKLKADEKEAQETNKREPSGYWCVLSEFKDSSGTKVDMCGCYVAMDMAVATMEVLTKKKAEIEAAIKAI